MNAVQMAAKLYECRDHAKKLLGDKYHDRMRDWGEVVTACAKQVRNDGRRHTHGEDGGWHGRHDDPRRDGGVGGAF